MNQRSHKEIRNYSNINETKTQNTKAYVMQWNQCYKVSLEICVCKKEKRPQINKIILHIKKLEKEE